MKVYDQLIDAVENGKRFKVDLRKRILKIDGEIYIDHGIVRRGCECEPSDSLFADVENLWDGFYYSRPSERSESNRHTYYKAMPLKNMSDEQLCKGKNREVERAKIEYATLMGILGNSKWAGGSWYWRSEKYPALIILKEWMEEEVDG